MQIKTRNHYAIFSSLLVLMLMAGLAWGGAELPTDSVEVGFDRSDVILLITYILLALVFSFLCSVAEAVLLSITPSYIANLQQHKPKRAMLLKKLKQENIDRSLAAILTLNTIAHTVGAIGSGAKATVVFGSAWFGVFSAVMTLMILFLSEIIPKTLGAVYWRSLSGVTAGFINLLIIALYPLIFVSELLTRLVARGKSVHSFNREEFVAMAEVGEESGHINERESRIIRNLFRFSSVKAEDVMTPRTVIVAFDANTTIDQALSLPKISPFSRFPIYQTNVDEICGFVIKDDLLLAKAQSRGGEPVSSLQREIMVVPADIPLSQLLEQLLDKRQHIARVTGPYGETEGLVTLEDVIETLLGMEIVDEADKVEDMQVLARQRWAKRAKALGIDVELTPANSDNGKQSD
jgi:CBS domain containing-hemolysin-like protein